MVKIEKERVLKPQAKHALKVHVGAAISKRGTTHVCVFDQIMDGLLYIKILENFLLPFLSTAFPDRHYRFMQVNDPKHTSRVGPFMWTKASIGGKHLLAV